MHEEDLCVHFITFSCYRKRRLLEDDRAKSVVVRVLESQLFKQGGMCAGFVIMPDHVHALVWFPNSGELSHFVKQWKQRSSFNIKRLPPTPEAQAYRDRKDSEPVWQSGYYDFKVYSNHKLTEKLTYIHHNPVRAGLVEKLVQWRFSSARFYDRGDPVGVPITPCF